MTHNEKSPEQHASEIVDSWVDLWCCVGEHAKQQFQIDLSQQCKRDIQKAIAHEWSKRASAEDNAARLDGIIAGDWPNADEIIRQRRAESGFPMPGPAEPDDTPKGA